MITKYDKAIAGIVTPILVSFILAWANQYDLGINEELAGRIAVLIVAGITGAVVYVVPNK